MKPDGLNIGYWLFDIVCDLVLEIWNLTPVLEIWNLNTFGITNFLFKYIVILT